jgi:hypothetical protein
MRAHSASSSFTACAVTQLPVSVPAADAAHAQQTRHRLIRLILQAQHALALEGVARHADESCNGARAVVRHGRHIAVQRQRRRAELNARRAVARGHIAGPSRHRRNRWYAQTLLPLLLWRRPQPQARALTTNAVGAVSSAGTLLAAAAGCLLRAARPAGDTREE